MIPIDINAEAQREKNKLKLISLLESSPGGITCSDIKSVMGDMKQTAIDALMNSLGDSLALWQEQDDSGDQWYHHPKFNHLYDKGEPSMANSGKYKRGRKIRAASIDEETYRKIKRHLADSDCTLVEFLTTAAEEKLAREVRK